MVYLQCPKCGNTSNTLYIEDVTFGLENKRKFQAVFCPNCEEPIFLFENTEEAIDELKYQVENLESRIDDLNNEIDSLNLKVRDLSIEEPTNINPY